MGGNHGAGRVRWLAGGLCLGLCLTAAGCGGTASVSGKVYYKGKPLTGGVVLFVSDNHKGTYRSDIAEDGSYRIDKVPTGPVKIAVDTSMAQAPAARQKGPPGGAGKMQPPKDTVLPESAKGGMYDPGHKAPERTAVKIPDHYANPEASNLTYTVTSGSQEHNIQLD
jgi:hypothetical protein